MAHAYAATRFDVAGQIPSLSEPLSLAAWVFAPPTLPVETPLPVLVCLPGGSYTKAYYHLEVPGFPEDAYSFALFLARQGVLVVALDHLGAGESTQPADGRQLTLQVMAQANALVVSQIRSRLADGTLIEGVPPQTDLFLVGVGHSMGSFLLVEQQVNYHNFAAIALLGYANTKFATAGLEKRVAEHYHIPFHDQDSVREVMSGMYRLSDGSYMDLHRPIAHTYFHANDVPASVIEADDALATLIPLGILVEISDPANIAPKAARIEVPIFLSNGDVYDLSSNFHAEPATYPLSRDITLFHLPDAAHCHNFASTRVLLWDRLARWIRAVHPR